MKDDVLLMLLQLRGMLGQLSNEIISDTILYIDFVIPAIIDHCA